MPSTRTSILAKSCPYCKSKPVFSKRAGDAQVDWFFRLGCRNEECPIKPESHGMGAQQVIKDWNTRCDETIVYELIEVEYAPEECHNIVTMVPCEEKHLKW